MSLMRASTRPASTMYNVLPASDLPSTRGAPSSRSLVSSAWRSVSARTCWSVLYFTENRIKIGAGVVGEAYLHQRSGVLNWQQEGAHAAY